MADLNKINFMSKSRYDALSNVHTDEIYAVKQEITDPLDTTSNGTELATAGWVKTILSEIYPIGSIYIGTQSTCPMATLISGSTWELVSEGKVLQGADSTHTAGTTIEPGLPNITGEMDSLRTTYASASANGAFTKQSNGASEYTWDVIPNSEDLIKFNFSASNSNSIYGNSNTVQPPAYVVNIWRRTA